MSKRTLGISPALSAASCSVRPPKLLGSVSEAIWSGRALDGINLGSAALLGTLVPSLAISKRSPPLSLPDSGMMKKDWVLLGYGILSVESRIFAVDCGGSRIRSKDGKASLTSESHHIYCS